MKPNISEMSACSLGFAALPSLTLTAHHARLTIIYLSIEVSDKITSKYCSAQIEEMIDMLNIWQITQADNSAKSAGVFRGNN